MTPNLTRSSTEKSYHVFMLYKFCFPFYHIFKNVNFGPRYYNIGARRHSMQFIHINVEIEFYRYLLNNIQTNQLVINILLISIFWHVWHGRRPQCSKIFVRQFFTRSLHTITLRVHFLKTQYLYILYDRKWTSFGKMRESKPRSQFCLLRINIVDWPLLSHTRRYKRIYINCNFSYPRTLRTQMLLIPGPNVSNVIEAL